ncbi:MAG TPA: hypothetical protein PLQ04_04415 [Lachnospiraceae bacterium]|nr:hypothetical protein [Lachnospiraceae bacterium]
MAKKDSGPARKKPTNYNVSKLDRFIASPRAFLRDEYGIGEAKYGRIKGKRKADERDNDPYEIIPDFASDELGTNNSNDDYGLGG